MLGHAVDAQRAVRPGSHPAGVLEAEEHLQGIADAFDLDFPQGLDVDADRRGDTL